MPMSCRWRKWTKIFTHDPVTKLRYGFLVIGDDVALLFAISIHCSALVFLRLQPEMVLNLSRKFLRYRHMTTGVADTCMIDSLGANNNLLHLQAAVYNSLVVIACSLVLDYVPLSA